MPTTRNMRATYIALASIAAGVLLLIVAFALLFVFGILHLPEPPVTVPNLTGLPGPTARSRLAEIGLLMGKGDVRFSATVPKGAVLGQDPAGGTLVPRGTVITVALSAGSEKFKMPDVTGLQMASALATLRGKGLATRVEHVDSRLASGTVIATLPSPGADVSTSDIVVVRVSAGARGGALLLPYDLKGVSIVIDPASSGQAPDIADEVARRLRSLLEASGARVTETRSVVDTNPPSVARQLRAIEASPTLVVGLYATQDPPGGIRVGTPPADGVTAPFYLRSVDLAKRTVTAFTEAGLKASTESAVGDTVLSGTAAIGERIHLGAYSNRSDARDFADPAWADLVARALYRGIGQTLAPRKDTAIGSTTASSTSATQALPATTGP
jgi:N-acetylmuramoyl-L-alanine amidase